MGLTYNEPSVYFGVQPHKTPAGYGLGEWVDLSSGILSGMRVFDASSGVWNITLKFGANSEMTKILDGSLYEGDPIKMVLANHQINRANLDKYKTYLGYIDTKSKRREVNPQTRAVSYVYTLEGRGWGRALFTPILCGTALQAEKTVKVPRADGATVEDTRGAPTIPGMITADSWAEIMSEVWTAAFQTAGNGTGRALRTLLQILMNNVWKNPLGEALIDRLSWRRFNKPSIYGIPWRIIELTMSGNVLTPDSILHQIGNESYNEIMYDYDIDSPNMPAIVFRPRPYGVNDKKVTFEIPNDGITYIESAQSGAERFNYFRSNAAIMSFNGIEILIDNKEGHSPIIDQESVERTGLRPVMPNDDFFPPLDKKDADITEYYVKRIRQYRDWYYNNHNFLSGIVRCKGLIPGSRIGTYVKIPETYSWRDSTTTTAYMGYVTGITEAFGVDPGTRGLTIDTSIKFVRGEPISQLYVPDVDSWVKPVAATPIENQDQPSEHITWYDLRCHPSSGSGLPETDVPESLRGSMREVALFVEKIAAHLGATSIGVVSGYRTQEYQDYLHRLDPSGVAKSGQHPKGKAIDFYLPGFTTAQIMTAIGELNTMSKIRRGWWKEYPSSSTPFVHYDIGPARPLENRPDL